VAVTALVDASIEIIPGAMAGDFSKAASLSDGSFLDARLPRATVRGTRVPRALRTDV